MHSNNLNSTLYSSCRKVFIIYAKCMICLSCLFLLFLIHVYTYSVYILLYTESIIFLDQIFEIEISMNLHVLRSPEFKYHIFSGYLWVCGCFPKMLWVLMHYILLYSNHIHMIPNKFEFNPTPSNAVVFTTHNCNDLN